MPILNETFPAFELKSDLAFIKNKAQYKMYNYDGLLYAGKKRFNLLYDSIQKVIDEKGEMNRIDFFLLTSPLIRLLQDDQSYYSLKGDYAYDRQKKINIPFAEKNLIPLKVYIFHDSVFIASDSSNLYKAHLISINDIPAINVVSEVLKHTTFARFRYLEENKYAFLRLANHPILSNVLFDFENEIEITYSPFDSDTILYKNLDLLPINDSSYDRSLEQELGSSPWYSLRFKNDQAVLRIYSLPDLELNVYFINDIFKQISKINPKGLIIDISKSYYSFGSLWLVILNYLYEGDLSIYEYHKEKRDLKKYTKKTIHKKDYVIGKFSDINMEYKFEGNIYLITGSWTGSSAVKFADLMKYNHLVDKIFGCETLIKSTQFNYSKKYYLPVTGISLTISTSLSYALDKNLDTHGLIPDVEVKPNTVNEYWQNLSNQFVIDKVINMIESDTTQNENTTH